MRWREYYNRFRCAGHVGICAGTSRSYLYAVLNGEKSPTLDWLERVAKVLSVDVHELAKPIRNRTTRVGR